MKDEGTGKKTFPKPQIHDRAPRVLLIYPPPSSPGYNNSPPLNLAMIAAALRDKGCEVRVADAAALLVDDREALVSEALEEMNPDVIAISLIVGNARNAYKLIKELLAPTNIPIIVGGPHATILPNEVLEHGAHIVVRGEGEAAAGELVEWFKGQKDLSEIHGISYRSSDGSIQHNPDRELVENLDELLLPAHEFFEPGQYFKTPQDKVRGGRIVSSRGCPFKCSFCSNAVFGRNFRYRSPRSIISEMEMLRKLYGIDRFEFVDDAFTANRARLLELASAIKELPDVTFSCVTRLENLDEETVPLLRSAGLFRVHIGVESARPETIERVHKNIDINALEPTLKLLRRNGVEAYLFFMFGFPWETADEMRETNRFIKKIKPLTAWFNEGGVLNPYPGTEIYDEYHEKMGFTDWWLNEWKSPGPEPLHFLQKKYFFSYNEDQLDAIREGLQIIFEHNRGQQLEMERFEQELARLKEEAEKQLSMKNEASGEIDRLQGIIHGLEEEVRDRDRLLKEIWGRSVLERVKRILGIGSKS